MSGGCGDEGDAEGSLVIPCSSGESCLKVGCNPTKKWKVIQEVPNQSLWLLLVIF